MSHPNVRLTTAAALTLAVLGMSLSTMADNLLTNPGFESPDTGTETPPLAWTTSSDILRESFAAETGKYGMWFKTFVGQEQETLYQAFNNGVAPNTMYTLNADFKFEANFPTIDAIFDYGMIFLDSTGTAIGNGAFSTLEANQVTTTGAFSTFTVSGTAPAGTQSIGVELDYYRNTGSGGSAVGWFVDNIDLEGAGTAPITAIWAPDSSGDWNNAGNWTNGSVPNSAGAEADFFAPPPVGITSAHTVYSDTPITVGTMNFNNPNTYVIAGAAGADGGPGLTLQTSSGNANILVQQGTQEINLPLTIASNTVFNVSSGATLVIADPMTINSGKSVSQTGSGTVNYESTVTVATGGSFAIGNSTHAHALTLQGNSNASIGGTGTTLELDSISLDPSAKMNVGKGGLNVDYTGASPAATLVNLIKTAYDQGKWDGNGITSAAAASTKGTGIGYLDTGSQIKIMFTWLGDLDLNGIINSSDFDLLGKPGVSWNHGDLNYDGVFNQDDVSLFQLGVATAGSKNISAVPEPGVLGLLLGAGLLIRRRKA